MDKFQLVLPITKVDALQRIVYGIAAAEVPDHASEIMDYESTKPNFMDWSEKVLKASDGKSHGNVRAMHGNVAAGVVKQLVFNDDERRIEISAHIIDNNEWEKVEKGVYTGFSMGGRYLKRWKDGELTRYTASPSEVSLVDMPCIPTATFMMIKVDGSTEMRKFVTANQEEPNDEAVKIAIDTENAQEDGQIQSPVDVERQVEKGLKKHDVTQIWDCGCSDHHHLKKSEAQKCADDAYEADLIKLVNAPIDDAIARLSAAIESQISMNRDAVLKFAGDWKQGVAVPDNFLAGLAQITANEDDAFGKSVASIKPDESNPSQVFNDDVMAQIQKFAQEELSKSSVVEKPLSTNFKIDRLDIKKSLSQVCCLASLLENLAQLQSWVECEAECEGDGSTLPDDLLNAVKILSGILNALVVEETNELLTSLAADADDAALQMFDTPEMIKNRVQSFVEKAGEIAKSDQHIELIEKIGRRNSTKDSVKIQEVHDHSVDLGASCQAEKSLNDEQMNEHSTLEHMVMRKKYEALIVTVNELITKVEAMGKKPALPQAKIYAFNKVDDGQFPASNAADEASLESRLQKMDPEERALLMTKIAFKTPINVRR